MAHWRSPRLEEIVGGPLDASGITEVGLRRLVDELPAESDIVDYKSKLTLLTPDKNPKWTQGQELAKDVCGPANSQGGVVIFGVEDFKKQPIADLRMQPFTTVIDGEANDLVERLRRDIRQYATPLPHFDVVTVSARDGAGFYLVVVIPPSAMAPHAVTVPPGVDRKALYFFLRQPGETSIRALTEYEIAGMYEARARRGRSLRQDLDEVWDEGANDISDSGGHAVWLTVAAVPEMPTAYGQLTTRARVEIAEWADRNMFPESILGIRSVEATYPFPAPERVIYQHLARQPDGSSVPRTAYAHRELYADGRVYAAVQIAEDPDGTDNVTLTEDGLVDDVQALVRHALGWMIHRTGQWGAATMRVGIVAAGVDPKNPFFTWLIDDSDKQVSRTRAVPRGRLPSAVVSVDLAEASSVQGQLAASYSTALPVLQAFGVAEPRCITPEGLVDPSNLLHDDHRHAAAWAGRHMVLAYKAL